jgi:hypothetical protein
MDDFHLGDGPIRVSPALLDWSDDDSSRSESEEEGHPSPGKKSKPNYDRTPAFPTGVAGSPALGRGGALGGRKTSHGEVQNLHHGGRPGEVVSSEVGHPSQT